MPRAATSSDVFNAVAEPQRRAILDFLAADERPVGDIVVRPSNWRNRRCRSTCACCATSASWSRAATAVRFSIARTPQAIRPLHEWTGQFERYWRHQLTRVKERAERIDARDDPNSEEAP